MAHTPPSSPHSPRRHLEVDVVTNKTILHELARKGLAPLINRVLSRNIVDADTKCRAGRTPLAVACSYGQLPIVKLLLSRDDVDPNAPDFREMTPIFQAVAAGHADVILSLMLDAGVLLNANDIGLRTPLTRAVLDRRVEVVEQSSSLSTAPSSPPSSSSSLSSPPQPLQLQQPPRRTASELALNDPDDESHTPLLWAAVQGYKEAVEALLRRPDIDVNQGFGYWTALQLACMRREVGILEALLRREDLDVNRVEGNSDPPLQCLLNLGGLEDLVEVLVKRGRGVSDSGDG
ncbi:ankyrin repeat-containing domain protein [Aspergillus pseudoustus]|uniref:Ankyrin repeat-containing domain protein n=1 Tax=Aspergillus pseudoustus TaxID=1810923 RepID=A0ABR4JGD7_9EURO